MTIDNYLAHHGIKGQRWGVRRYQNPDGTRTEAGKLRYQKGTVKVSADTKLVRFASSNEPIDKKRKYVSFKDDDIEEYEKFAVNGELWTKKNKGLSKYTYKPIKDLNFVNGNDAFADIIGAYGNKRIKDLNQKLISSGNKSWNVLTGDEQDKLFEFVKHSMKTKMSDLEKRYTKAGYDGMVDVEDYISTGLTPLVLFSPIDKITLVSEEKIR